MKESEQLKAEADELERKERELAESGEDDVEGRCEYLHTKATHLRHIAINAELREESES